MTGLAMASRELAERPAGKGDELREWLSRDLVSVTLSALAIGELAVDKLPDVPDRIEPAPMAARGFIGAVLGAVAGGDDHWVAGAILGGAAALASAWVGWSVRKEAGWATGLPDPVIALVEDAIAVTGAREAAREL
jgi:uncharacterized membrane protein